MIARLFLGSTLDLVGLPRGDFGTGSGRSLPQELQQITSVCTFSHSLAKLAVVTRRGILVDDKVEQLWAVFMKVSFHVAVG